MGQSVQLNGWQLKLFHDALLSAFPTPGSLARMVSFELDENLDEIAGGQNHSEVIFALLQWAKSRGRLEELTIAALSENPNNSDLCEFVKQFQLLPPNASVTHVSTPSQPENVFDDTFIQGLQEHCRQKILNQHSRMRLLSGFEIGVDQLYVDVWLLNRPPRTFQVSQPKLLETFDLRNDRLGLGKKICRNPGFEVANANTKLLILGKPGSGKTTFLKHLAVDWCKGKFQPDLIAVFAEFRRIRDKQWNLIDIISQELGLKNNQQNQKKKRRRNQEMEEPKDQQQVKALLERGKFLVLMDGLDEVPTKELRDRVQNQLLEITERYPQNRFVLTCRTQIIELIPTGFTSVEVAEFTSKQIKQFVQNWFIATGESRGKALKQGKIFEHSTDKNLGLQELRFTPVLLSLMCLVLQDEGEIPSKVDWLYEKGIKLLLNRWNDDKRIDGWEIGSATYQKLNVEQRQELLVEVAARKFKNPRNFVLFEQQEIAAHITEFLKLSDIREGVAVLKAIEAHHGLLIERADELWSFSHLTFQEYFTVRWLTQLSSDQLAEEIANPIWRENIKQIVKSQQPADRLVRLIKEAIDQSIARKPAFNQFLIWVTQKSESIQTVYKSTSLRAFYFAFALTLDRNLALACDRKLDQDLACDRNLDCNPTCELDRAIALDHAFDRACTLIQDLNCALELAINSKYPLDCNRASNRARVRARLLIHTLDRILARALIPELQNELKQLKAMLPLCFGKDWQRFQQWWLVQGEQWNRKLHQIMIKHHTTGHDWQFTGEQKQQLQSYYEANKFLIELIRIPGAVSETVGAEIEETLLLWNHLKKQ